MEAKKLMPGDIVQLSPESVWNQAFSGCFMVVTEPKAWGAQGFVQGLGDRTQPAGQAYYRAHWDEMEETGGRAVWLTGSLADG